MQQAHDVMGSQTKKTTLTSKGGEKKAGESFSTFTEPVCTPPTVS